MADSEDESSNSDSLEVKDPNYTPVGNSSVSESEEEVKMPNRK